MATTSSDCIPIDARVRIAMTDEQLSQGMDWEAEDAWLSKAQRKLPLVKIYNEWYYLHVLEDQKMYCLIHPKTGKQRIPKDQEEAEMLNQVISCIIKTRKNRKRS